MKKLFTLLFTLLSTTAILAYDFEVDGIYYSISEHNAKEVRVTYKYGNNRSYSGSVLIPSTVTYNGITYSVTSVGNWAFEGCTGLTSITIPSSVKSIGWGAFSGCSGLTSVTIPNSVTWIGGEAFEGCTGLTSITIPNSVTSIGEGAFENCSNLTSITIPNSVKSIGRRAFEGCSSLTSINIPNNVMKIVGGAFRGCGLTSPLYNSEHFIYMPPTYQGAYTIPAGIKEISACAFAECSSLTSITIPNSVKSIGQYAFYNCSSLTSVSIPESVERIEEGAFAGCKKLQSISDHNNIKYIGDRAFDGCPTEPSCPLYKMLKSLLNRLLDDMIVTTKYRGGYYAKDVFVSWGCMDNHLFIKDGTKHIGHSAFHEAEIENVIIPASIKLIGYDAFEYCWNLKAIYCKATIPPYFLMTEDFWNKVPHSITAYVPKQSLHLYQKAEGWKEFQLKPYNFDKSNEIFNYQPINSADLELVSYKGKCPKQVEVPSFATLNDSIYTVTSIAQQAFKNQKSLRSITIPSTVHHIGKEAFCGTGIYANKKNWQEGVLYVDKCLIKANSEISGEHIVPAGTHVIAEEAFDGCIWLGGVVLPESLTHINSAAFRGCKWLVKITSHSYTPPVLADDVFEHVDVSLTKVYVPSYALDYYKQAEGWKMFKHILPIPDDDSL